MEPLTALTAAFTFWNSAVMTLFCTGLAESALSSESTVIEPPPDPPPCISMLPEPTMLCPFIVFNEVSNVVSSSPPLM